MWCLKAKFRTQLILLMMMPAAAFAAPPLAAPAAQENLRNESLHLSNTERNDKLWALLQYESTYGKIELHSFRKFGDYSGTNLRAVKAVGFHLANFNFSKADLRGADFRSADLRGANFCGADLRESVLISAKTAETEFDSETQLPYSREEALKRGWREVTR